MNNIFKKHIISSLIITVVIGLGVSLQSFVVKVEAQVDPITLSTYALGFGMVFPGEELEKEFVVNLVTQGADWVEYKIVQTPKPGYLDLCPFLEKESQEAEGDTEGFASLDVNNDPSDVSDIWRVILDVPAISGFVGQDHALGVIEEGGEYGCDIGVETINWGQSGG